MNSLFGINIDPMFIWIGVGVIVLLIIVFIAIGFFKEIKKK